MDGFGRVWIDGGEAANGARARDRKRDSLFMTARLQMAGSAASHEVRVRNLSEGGLMVEFERGIAPGAAVTLDMRGLGELTGTVAWCTRGRAGIAFDHPIDPKRARKTIGGRAKGDAPKPMLVARAPRRS